MKRPLVLDFSCLLDDSVSFEHEDNHICSSYREFKEIINLDLNGDSIVDEFDYESYLDECCADL